MVFIANLLDTVLSRLIQVQDSSVEMFLHSFHPANQRLSPDYRTPVSGGPAQEADVRNLLMMSIAKILRMLHQLIVAADRPDNYPALSTWYSLQPFRFTQ
jgi:hypothetical protein